MKAPTTRNNKSKHQANGDWFNHRTESIMIIYTVLLYEASSHKPRLVFINRTIGTELRFEDPFAANNVSARWKGYQYPRFVSLKCLELSLHSSTPSCLRESSAMRCRLHHKRPATIGIISNRAIPIHLGTGDIIAPSRDDDPCWFNSGRRCRRRRGW